MKQLGLKFKGISLLEVMLSLAIIAIILLLATRYFGIASTSNNVNSEMSQVNEIRQGTQQFYVNSGDYPKKFADLAPYTSANTAAGNAAFAGATITWNTGTPPTVSVTTPDPSSCNLLAARLSTTTTPVTCKGNTATVSAVPTTN